jgi:phosphatidylinositol alpha-mannosyltransferase
MLDPLIERITAKIAVSETARDTLKDRFQTEAVVIPNGIDTNKFNGIGIRAEWALPNTIGFIGRLEPRKGVLELSEALCRVLPDFPDWKVKIAGSSTGSCVSGIDPAVVVQMKLARFAEQVDFLDRIEPSDVPDWLASLGICIFPSIWETFSYVTLEAAQAGKAIIGTRTGAVPEILDNGRAGLIVPPGDVSALAKALRKLMADGELRRNLGVAARRRFEERFHPDRVMGEILEVYREAMERARGRRQEV